MKPVQIMMEEKLLADLDADEEVRRLGRSAVLRRIAAEYLARRRRRAVMEAYRQAYGGADRGLGDEFDGWEDEGAWPTE